MLELHRNRSSRRNPATPAGGDVDAADASLTSAADTDATSARESLFADVQPVRTGRVGWVVAWSWIGLVVFAAIFADLLPLWDPETPDFLAVHGGPSADHLLGADSLGRDILSRAAFGARASLLVGLSAVLLGILVGGTIGVVAGYRRGPLERVIMTITDAMLAFPPLVLLLALVAVLGANLRNLIIGLAIGATPTFIRLTRANTLVVAEREFVTAARGYGSKRWRVMLREVAPNVLPSVAAYGFIMIGVFIVVEGILSFLGLGVQPPTPSWGGMIAAGRQPLTEHPHVALIPAFIMFLTVLSINYIGERVRKRYDVKDSQL